MNTIVSVRMTDEGMFGGYIGARIEEGYVVLSSGMNSVFRPRTGTWDDYTEHTWWAVLQLKDSM